MSNKYIIGGIAAALLALGTSPAFAQTHANARAGGGFCANISTVQSRVETALTNIAQRVSDLRTSANGKSSSRWTTADQKLAAARASQEQSRQSRYAALEAKAKNDTQKAAVAAFKNAIDAAVSTRQAAIDAAVKAYRDGIDAALSANVTAAQSAAATFKSSVDAAFATAQNSCSIGANNSNARTALSVALKAARSTFQASHKRGALASTHAQHVQTRNAAIQQALSNYKTAAQAAIATLRSAFGVPANNATSTH